MGKSHYSNLTNQIAMKIQLMILLSAVLVEQVFPLKCYQCKVLEDCNESGTKDGKEIECDSKNAACQKIQQDTNGHVRYVGGCTINTEQGETCISDTKSIPQVVSTTTTTCICKTDLCNASL